MRLFMRSRGLGLIGVAALVITSASAETIEYSTSGSFGSSGTAVLSDPGDGLTITYGNENNLVTVPPSPTNASFGQFTVVGPTPGDSVNVSDTFSLTITQTMPSSGNETLTDTFAGTLSSTNSEVVLTFSGGNPTSPLLTTNPITGLAAYEFQLGDVAYWVNQTTAIVPQSTNNGVSSIEGAIAAPVPDGGVTLMLLGGVLVGIESVRRKLRV